MTFDQAQSPRLGQRAPVESTYVQFVDVTPGNEIEDLIEAAYPGQLVFREDLGILMVYNAEQGAWQAVAGGEAGQLTYVQADPPDAHATGDLWFDSDDANHPYVASAPGTTSWMSLIGPPGPPGPQGVSGPAGSQGVPGPPGEDGQQLYTWLKYADTPTTGMSNDPAGKAYMGLAYNKVDPVESSVYTDYSWSLIQGEDGVDGEPGVPGPPGADGQPTWTWVKYADTPTTGMSDLPANKPYIGFAYNKATAVESSVYGDYAWSLILGPQGPQGIQGPAGANGQPTYTWVKYAPNANPSNAQISDDPAGMTYMGMAYNKTTATESTVAADYAPWVLIQGPAGSAGSTGPAGSNGISVTAVTPYYALVTTGAAAPAKPTTVTPVAPWVATEPAYAPLTELYHVEKVTYSDATFSYSVVSKSSAYTASTAAMDQALHAANLADGKMRIFREIANPDQLQLETIVPNSLPVMVAEDDGDLWFRADEGNKAYTYNHATGLWIEAPTGLDALAEAVTTPNIPGRPGSIAQDLTDSDLTGATITGALIQTREEAQRGIKIGTVESAEGLYAYADDGTPFLTAIPSTGMAVVAGEVKATTLTVTEKATLGGLTEVTRHVDGTPGAIRLTAGTTAPGSAPIVTTGYTTQQFNNTGTALWSDRYGWCTDGRYWFTCYDDPVSGEHSWLEVWDPLTSNFYDGGIINGAYSLRGCVYHGGFVYTLGKWSSGYEVFKWSVSALPSGPTYLGQNTWQHWAAGEQDPAIGIDRATGELCIVVSKGDYIRFRWYNWNSTSGGNLVATGSTDTTLAYDVDFSGVTFGPHDFGLASGIQAWVISSRSTGDFRVFSQAGADIPTRQWQSGMPNKIGFDWVTRTVTVTATAGSTLVTAAPGTFKPYDVGFTISVLGISQGIITDYIDSSQILIAPTVTSSGTVSATIAAFVSMDKNGLMRVYGQQDHTLAITDPNLTKWFSNTLANATKETNQSPRARIIIPKRSKVHVTTSAINSGGANAPDRVRIYVGKGATDPGQAAMNLCDPSPSVGDTNSTYGVLGISATHPPATNGFGADGAVQRLEMADGTLIVDGLGNGSMGGGGAGTTGPRARLIRTSDVTVADDTPYTVFWQAAEFSEPATFADVAGNRLVIPETGLYLINAYAPWDNINGTGYRTVYIYVDDTLVRYERQHPDAADDVSSQCAVLKWLTAGQIIDMRVRQTAGAGLVLNGSSGGTQAALEAAKLVVGAKGDPGDPGVAEPIVAGVGLTRTGNTIDLVPGVGLLTGADFVAVSFTPSGTGTNGTSIEAARGDHVHTPAAIGAAPTVHTHTKANITDLGTIGTAAAKDVPPSGDASTAQVVMGNDTRMTNSRTPVLHTMDLTADSATRLAMTTAERTKLTGVATGATANSSDATLLARANHTGTQLKSTISDFAHNHAASEVTSGAFLVDRMGSTPAATTYLKGAAAGGLAAWATTGTLKTDLALTKTDVGLANVDNTTDAAKPVSTATQTALNAKIDTSTKAAANGVASLDASTKVPIAQIPTGSTATTVSLGTHTHAGLAPALNIKDEGVTLTGTPTGLNFVGDGVTVTGTPEPTITIPGYTPPGVWSTYTPTFTAATTNPTLGNFTRDGRWTQIGKTVHFSINIVCNAASGFGTGTYDIGLPVPVRDATHFVCSARQGSPTRAYIGFVSGSVMSLTDTAAHSSMNSSNSGMASGTSLRISGTYEAA